MTEPTADTLQTMMLAMLRAANNSDGYVAVQQYGIGTGGEAEMRAVFAVAQAALAAQGADTRPCTCHPDDNPPRPCPRKFALGECRAASEAAQGAEPAAWIAPTSLDWHSVESERIVKVTQRAQPQRGFTTPLYAAPLTAQGATRIDPMQDPMRPTLAKLGPSDEHPAEEVLRKLACWLGVGGYNAPTVDADLFHRKIVAGIEDLRKNAAQGAEPVASKWLGPFTDGAQAIDELRRACAEIIGADPETWPSHGNAPLAIAAALGLRQAALSKPAAQPVPAWIACSEEMPQSGQKVLACYRNRNDMHRTILAEWIAAKSKEGDEEHGDLDLIYDDAADCYYWPEGWYEVMDNWPEYSHLVVSEGDVTYWMPLPAPPDAAR